MKKSTSNPRRDGLKPENVNKNRNKDVIPGNQLKIVHVCYIDNTNLIFVYVSLVIFICVYGNFFPIWVLFNAKETLNQGFELMLILFGCRSTSFV